VPVSAGKNKSAHIAELSKSGALANAQNLRLFDVGVCPAGVLIAGALL